MEIAALRGEARSFRWSSFFLEIVGSIGGGRGVVDCGRGGGGGGGCGDGGVLSGTA